jgi:hypothetical protein
MIRDDPHGRSGDCAFRCLLPPPKRHQLLEQDDFVKDGMDYFLVFGGK